jgi:hypothetical protein
MHGAVNSGSFWAFEFKMRIQYVPAQEQVTLHGILKRWVMIHLAYDQRNGFCKHGKEASSSDGRHISGLQSNKDLLVLCFKHHHALMKIQ